MNKWKYAFLTLVAFLIIVVVAVLVFIFSGSDDALPNPTSHEGNHIEVKTTTDEFAVLANHLIADATKETSVQTTFEMNQNMTLNSKVDVFGIDLPVKIIFDPTIDNAGNIKLQATDVTIGKLDIPPQAALKLVKDAEVVPEWITIQPSEKQAYFDLSTINVPIGDSMEGQIEAKEIDFESDTVIIDFIVSTN